VIILDTNVLSELMKAKPSEVVIAWLARQSRKNLSTTSITKAEILYGVARLPEGRRKAALAADAERMFGGISAVHSSHSMTPPQPAMPRFSTHADAPVARWPRSMR
jgi:predicted nucleic acid-binding protein